MPISLVRVPVDALAQFTLDCFLAMGVPRDEAEMCARGLMHSELRCLPGQGQGVRRLPVYHERISKGWIEPGAPYEVVKESPSLALIDAHNGLGSPAAQRAMRLAVEKAKATGLGTVLVKNGTHFGSAAVPALIAVENDCIGMAYTNAGPEMAPWGGASGVTGTNPWGIAAPTGLGFPLVLDIALTTAGKGMMQWYAREGKKMPLDWALTPEGEETDDPNAAMQGFLLPIGQHKGYGLAVMTDVLTGILGGAGFGLMPYSNPARQDVSYTMTAYHIDWFRPLAEFKADVDQFVHDLKAARKRPGVREIFVPGELDARREQAYRQHGAQLDAVIFDQLAALAETLRIAFPFARELVADPPIAAHAAPTDLAAPGAAS
ncbi:MAG TPA: Ldh family oxidoreductase [Candidatus Limnocylindrales bacterium]|nr:Ldh family oxidoreductase [Candidatus Limnocylindrales bacterium]